MIKYSALNILGKLNFIFMFTNLFCAFTSAVAGSPLCFLHVAVSFLCYISCFAPNCNK